MLLVQKLCSTVTIINHTPHEIRIFEERKIRTTQNSLLIEKDRNRSGNSV